MSNKNHGLYCYACMSQINAGDSVCPHCHASVPYCAQDARPHDLPCGAKLRDRFVVGRVIGRGGFGVLYLAYDEHMRTTRAIKEFFPKNAVRNRETLALEYDLLEIQTDMEKSRFLEEARLLTALQDMHIPNILRVFDEFEENNTSYILMEYVDGTNLDNYLQEKLNGKMPWREAVEVMQVLLDAVEQLHKNGIIHRDISLSNVMRRSDGRLCLIDFGSAWQMTSRADPYTSRKPAYSPREQWENGPQGVYSDIYALGVCLFKLIVGGLPKDGHGDGLPLLRSQATPETIPEWLETAVSTATQVDPKKRYASCAEFKQALRRAPRHSKNKVLLSACLLAVLAVGFAIGGVHLLTGGSGGVRQVQKALTAMGYLKANKPSGELDPETLLAMKAFGDEFGVAYTGEMNSEMESAILNAVQGNGKNLFGVDRDIQLTTYHASATADMNAPNKGVTFSTLSAINTENAGNAFLRIGNLDIREKGMYTFSADVRALDDVDVKLSLCGNEEGETVHITSKSTRISVSMNCTDIGNGASGYVDFFGTIDGQNILYLFNIKVEKGSTATDWSSPEPATPQVVTVTPSVSVQETDTPEPGDVTDSVTQQPSVNRNLFGFNKQITLSAPSGGSVYMNNGVNGLIFFTDENGADGTLLRIENPGMTEMGFYTFSADVEASCEAEISVSLCDAMPAQQFSVSNVKRRIEVTANCTQYVGDGTYTGFVSISGSIAPQCTLQFSNIKIEQGSTATEWSMAPEDDPNALPVDTPVPAESSVPADTSTPEPTPEPTATPVPEVHGDGVNLFGFLNGVESLSFADGVISSEQQLNGVSFTGGSNDSATTFLRISKLNMTEEGYYTFSANVRASQEVTVSFDMCDSEMLTFTATPAWQHISFSTYCTNYVSASEANGFADMYGLITEGNTITFANIKVENGNVPTAWSMAPADVPTPTPEPTPEPTATPVPEVYGDGVNLFGFLNGAEAVTFADVHLNPRPDIYGYECKNNSTSETTFFRLRNLNMAQEGFYNFSADVYALQESTVCADICDVGNVSISLQPDWQHISFSAYCPAGAGYVDFYGALTEGDYFVFANIKVENGNVPTAWSMAPADVPTPTPEPTPEPTATPVPEVYGDGVNLFGFLNGAEAVTFADVHLNPRPDIYGYECKNNSTSETTFFRLRNLNMAQEGFYNFSADVYALQESTVWADICDVGNVSISLQPDWQHISFSAYCPAGAGYVDFYGALTEGDYFVFANIKVENGNVPTAWSMAPADVPTPTPEPTATPVPEVYGDGVNLFGFLNGVENLSFADGVISSEQQLHGVSFTGGSNDSATTFLRISNLNMTEEGYYTFSANVCASQEVTVSFDMCDSEMFTFTATPAWQHISFSTYCTNYVSASEANGFADMYGLITEGNTITFADIKIENGNVPTAWSMAPADVPTPTPEPTPEPTATPVPEVYGDGVNLFGFLNGVENLSFADGVISSEQQLHGVSFTGGSNDSATTFLRISNLNMTEEGYYTFSANVCASQEVTVSFDMCDSEMFTFTATPAWQHISFSTYCTNYVSASEANGFADMYGLITEGNTITFADIKIENGNVPTAWTAAPGEVLGDGINLFDLRSDITVLSFADMTVKLSPDEYGVYTYSAGESETTFMRVSNLKLPHEGYYTFSADVYAAYDCTISMDLCDTDMAEFNLTAGQQHITFAAYCTATENGFLDAYGYIQPEQQLSFANIKIESGNVPTAFSVAPEYTAVSSSQTAAWPVVEFQSVPVTLDSEDERVLAYIGPDYKSASVGGYKPKKTAQYTALFREGNYVYCDAVYPGVERRCVYFNSANVWDYREVTAVTFEKVPAIVMSSCSPYLGSQEDYEQFSKVHLSSGTEIYVCAQWNDWLFIEYPYSFVDGDRTYEGTGRGWIQAAFVT